MVVRAFESGCRMRKDQSLVWTKRFWRRRRYGNEGRKKGQEESGREKSIQVFLITTAEKTATKRKMKERGLKIEKKNQSLAEKIFLVLYFSNYHSEVCMWV